MGKKKEKSKTNVVDSKKATQVQDKEQKSYTFGTDKSTDGVKDEVTKVVIDVKLEAAMLELIQKEKKEKLTTGTVSQRLTTKKLTDMYQCLTLVGFHRKQIEDAMMNIIPFGGDLVDCLDWLCLNTSNDELPEGFSQALLNEEQKLRPKFNLVESSEKINMHSDDPSSSSSSKFTKKNVKDWILSQYSDEISSSEEETEEEREKEKLDPNEYYLELTAKMYDMKLAARKAKQLNDNFKLKELNKEIKTIVCEIDKVKQLPELNQEILLKESDSDEELRKNSKTELIDSDNNMETVSASLEILEEDALKSKSNVTVSKKVEKRCFVYTRQQWTGKSPKQFLNDWVRKHLPQSSNLSYEKMEIGGGLWKSRCKITRKSKEGGDLLVCPELACDNLKDAEHLASTLALYNLCHGQDIHLLLPLPYRDIWLEWRRSEEAKKKEVIEEDNKPREEFIKSMMKTLKADVTCSAFGDIDQKHDNQVKDSWDKETDSEEENDASFDTSYVNHLTITSNDDILDVRSIYRQNKRKEQFERLLQERQRLPVFQFKDEIMKLIRERNIFIVAGETGCGKSTQIPQFILESLVLENDNLVTNQYIVCTQPRRISATSLANRVSSELGESGPGKHDSLCGYQIRFEKRRSRLTRLLYCTTGVILRQLQDDSYLRNISCVIVDEVHERSVESDFLLINLRELCLIRPELKVILMSATIDSSKFSNYFNNCPVVEIPGRSFPVTVYHLEDIIERIGYVVDEDSPYTIRYDHIIMDESCRLEVSGQKGQVRMVNASWTKEDILTIDNSCLDPEKYSLRTRNTVTRLNEKRVNLDLIIDLLNYINYREDFKEIDGAILIFLPGFSHIQELNDLLLADRTFGNSKQYVIVVLHSILSSENQSVAFKNPQQGIRKIVLATNVAETGITISDVVFVIDSGKEKENRYLETSRMSQLQEVFISKASAKQRQGRAGRVRDGLCFRLYTQRLYEEKLTLYSIPEILRVPLEELCLHIMKCNLGQPEEFLSKAINPPTSQAISRAMLILREVGACNSKEPTLTPLGHFLSLLPVDVHLGKMLVYGAILGCLEPAAVIAASMTDKSPFVTPIERRDAANTARNHFAVDNSDHLTLYNAFIGWKNAKKLGFVADRRYCEKNFLRRTSLINIENVSQDLMKMVRLAGLDCNISSILLKSNRSSASTWQKAFHIQSDASSSSLSGAFELSQGILSILKAILTAGLYPNVARLSFVTPVDQSVLKTEKICIGKTTQGVFQVHPSSVNRYLATNGWLIFQEKVKYSQVFLRDTTLVGNYAVLLFGGNVDVQHKQQLVVVDDWLQFKAPAKTGVLFKEMRLIIGHFLQKKLNNPQFNISRHPLIPVLLELLASEAGS